MAAGDDRLEEAMLDRKRAFQQLMTEINLKPVTSPMLLDPVASGSAGYEGTCARRARLSCGSCRCRPSFTAFIRQR